MTDPKKPLDTRPGTGGRMTVVFPATADSEELEVTFSGLSEEAYHELKPYEKPRLPSSRLPTSSFWPKRVIPPDAEDPGAGERADQLKRTD